MSLGEGKGKMKETKGKVLMVRKVLQILLEVHIVVYQTPSIEVFLSNARHWLDPKLGDVSCQLSQPL